ncbi:calicin [Pelodytes ibericus]
MEFNEKDHSLRLLNHLNCQRQRKEYCDLIVCIAREEFYVHRCVLEAFSPIARDFIEDKEAISGKVIRIDSTYISPRSVEQLLDYFYTGKVILSNSNVEEIAYGAIYFSLLNLKDHCESYLRKNTQKGNCLHNLLLAEKFNMENLKDFAYGFFRNTFYSMVPSGDNSMEISKNLLKCPPLIFSRLIKDDDLCVRNEEQVLWSLIKWVEHKPHDRIIYFDRLFSHVSLNGIPNKALFAFCTQEQLIMRSSSAMAKIKQVLKSQQLDTGLENYKDKDLHLPLKYLAFQRHGAILETVLVLGGQKADNTFSAIVHAYLLEQGSWLKLTDMPYKASGLSAATCGNVIYISGGATEKNSALKSAWKYDITTNLWSQMPDLPEGLAFHTMVTCNGSLYIVGGSYAPSAFSSRIYSFNSLKNKWILVGNMSIAMDVLCVAIRDNNSLYIVTGRCVVNGVLSRVGVVEEFDVISGKGLQGLTFPIKFKHRPLVWFQGDSVLSVQNHKQNLEIELKKMKKIEHAAFLLNKHANQ